MTTEIKEFDHLDLRNKDFRGRDLEGCFFDYCDLRKCDFTDADLYWATFADCDMRECSFRNADLRGVNFWTVQLDDADLTNANLGIDNVGGHTELCGLDLSKVELGGTNLVGAYYNEETLLPTSWDPEAHGMIRRYRTG